MENRILVLDDDPGILEAIDLSLTYCGFKVRPMLSGDNVFRMIDDFEPDLIILDYLLAGRNGGEICQDLKSDPGKKNIPVIMLSAHPEAAVKNAQFGCDSFLPKPFDLNMLVNEIKSFINPEPIIIR
ncbi:response regulator [Daejeonella sp. JGW-45]|uniref:response regulator transcription factor n=1 Tax=Daejeonella sp. JGW-45 TaxID=3034148 RepID=UPI0023EC5331|nr:response regulator [Daejeonella sp. JGW-45]